MVTRKDRKHSGRYTPQLHQKMNQSKIIKYAFEPAVEYDDWRDMRDGLRHNSDRSHLRSEQMWHWNKTKLKKENRKIKKQIIIRKAKEYKKRLIILSKSIPESI